MSVFVRYESGTGRIKSVFGAVGDDISPWLLPGESALIVDKAPDPLDAYWVPDGEVLARDVMPLSVQGATVTAPPGVTFELRGPAGFHEGVSEDGVLEFEFAEPGTYTVVLRLFPYLDAEVTLEG